MNISIIRRSRSSYLTESEKLKIRNSVLEAVNDFFNDPNKAVVSLDIHIDISEKA